jgi:hypothetical protein
MAKESDALDYRRRYRGLIGVKRETPIRDVPVLSRIYPRGGRGVQNHRKRSGHIMPVLARHTREFICDELLSML